MAETRETEESVGQLGALAEQVKLLQEKQAKDSSRDEEMARLQEQVSKLTETLSAQDRKRKTEFVEDDTDRLGNIERESGAGATVKAMWSMRSNRPEVVELQTELDNLYILGMCLAEEPKSKAIREAAFNTRYFKDACSRNPVLRRAAKAMDTSTLSDWIPSELSPELHRQVRLNLRVAALFRRIQMPAPSYKLPVQGNRPTIYLVPEQGDADAEVTEAKKVTAGSVAAAKRQLDAVKMGGRIVVSGELVEDSIVPMLEFIRSELAEALAAAEEDACLNGSAAGTLDSDSTASTHRRRAWDGLRQIAKTAGFEYAVATAGRLEITDLRKLRAKMTKYALSPNDATIVVSTLGYTQLLGLTDANGNPLVVTRDKYGDKATLVTGEVAQLDGFPIVTSGEMRDNLNRFGVYDGVTTDSSVMLMVNRKQFVFGDWRTPTLKSKEIIDTDQFALVTLMREDFLGFVPSEAAVATLYGIRTV